MDSPLMPRTIITKNGLFAGIAYPDYPQGQCYRTSRWIRPIIRQDKGHCNVTDGSSSASVSGSASITGDLKALYYSWKTAHDGFYGGGLGAALVSDEIKSVGGNASIS